MTEYGHGDPISVEKSTGDDAFEMKLFEYKVNISNCPILTADPNESAIHCDEYYCMRECKLGFEPMYPQKVFCKRNDDSGAVWATHDDGGEHVTLGGCKVIELETVEFHGGAIHRLGNPRSATDLCYIRSLISTLDLGRLWIPDIDQKATQRTTGQQKLSIV